MNKKELHADILVTMARYFNNRRKNNPSIDLRQSDSGADVFELRIPNSTSKTYIWDKDADRIAVRKAADKHGWEFATVAGTMWFYRAIGATRTLRIECDEDNYLDGGRHTVSKVIKGVAGSDPS